METEITVPEEIPVMTLPNLIFFPQALLPLHIFEPRYRQMLRDVLASNRLFAVAGLDPNRLHDPKQFEPPYRIASVGIVRACQKNDNGTSNLLLQGLCRVEILQIVGEDPYRRIQVRALSSIDGDPDDENSRLRSDLLRLLTIRRKQGAATSAEMTEFLRSVEDPETFVDLAAFGLCEDAPFKQRLLETLDVHRRLRLFKSYLQDEIAATRLRTKLQGGLPDDQISHN
jgi:Lon protease-like protein